MHKCLHSCLKQIPEARLPLPPQGVAEGLLIKQEHTGLIKHASPVREHPRTIIQRTKGLCIQGQISELIWVQRGLQGSGQEGADKQLQGEAESQWESSDMWFGTVLIACRQGSELPATPQEQKTKSTNPSPGRAWQSTEQCGNQPQMVQSPRRDCMLEHCPGLLRDVRKHASGTDHSLSLTLTFSPT